jgi:alanyl-tRNA synthetase
VKTAEIRAGFLEFFKSKGHQIVPSSNLVPIGDPTLLFTNAGMVQFKDVFLGTDPRPYTRATTCQKSLRISGKHNDLENVGRTARHHTFFEMLGNFSFGDYFKEDAIKYAWEFITEVLKLPKERLWVTIFEEDDEAGELWKKTSVLPGRILKRGKSDNFWAMGDTGPCGPCTEIFYFLGSDDYVQKGEELLADDPTYVEIWNLVFMQFNRDTKGTLHPLPKPSVDTGMGLERVAAVKQGKMANYDADSLRSIIAFTEKLSGHSYLGVDYTERDATEDIQYAYDVAFRVVADHSRSCAFLVAEGVHPSSDGRGYVLRRLIRRACKHGRALGLKEPFLNTVAKEVIKTYSEVYPELLKEQNNIIRIIRDEEEKFLSTFETGLNILEKRTQAVLAENRKILDGATAFQLHDTYGFPFDLTEDIVRAKGMSVDVEGFTEAMEAQRERSRSARSSQTALIIQRAVKPYATKFVGYDYLEYETKVVGLYDENGPLKSAKEGAEIAVVVENTPFYAESGGQVGDTGRITHASGTIDVVDTIKAGGDTIVHIGKVLDGEFSEGMEVRMAVDAVRRNQIRVHHSATHVLHLALREVLGSHIKQAGSRVSENSFRFDFTHGDSLSRGELEEIEASINKYVLANHEINTHVLPIEEAKNIGAVALFGEKYGDVVRVVQIGDRSKEFCGGTHAGRSGDLGIVQIISEGSVSSGVRRIEAVAGLRAVAEVSKSKSVILNLSEVLQANSSELLSRVVSVQDKLKEQEKELSRHRQSDLSSLSETLFNSAKERSDGYKIISSKLDGVQVADLRTLTDSLRDRLGSSCVCLISTEEDKMQMIVAVSKDLSKKISAGDIVKKLVVISGGKGGGRPDLAQAGGGDINKIEETLKAFEALV